MASDPFDFSDVFAEIESEIDEIMNMPTSKETLQNTIVKSVYNNVYPYYGHGEGDINPRHYHRRYENGGLGDPNNYEVVSGHLTMEVTNNTTGNGDQPGESWTSGPINDIIEEGVGYGWRHSRIFEDQPAPRPFMAQGVDEFVDDYLIPLIEIKCFNSQEGGF